jgi:hypothetical protein
MAFVVAFGDVIIFVLLVWLIIKGINNHRK